MGEPTAPCILDQTPLNTAAHSEMHMESVPALCHSKTHTYGNAEPPRPERRSRKKAPTWLRSSFGSLHVPGTGQRAKLVKAIGNAIAPKPETSTPASLRCGTLRVKGGSLSDE